MIISDLANLKKKFMAGLVIPFLIRPWSFDSWVGGSTDEFKKAVVEKKVGKNFAEIFKCIGISAKMSYRHTLT